MKATLMYMEEQIEKQETYDNELESSDENEATTENLVSLSCDKCEFSSASQRGLSVHIGAKHKKTP